MKQASVETTADAYLEILAARGIEYFFGNGGTDFGPIVDAYARRLELELPVPTPVTVPHEIPLIAMAQAYTMVTGRPQVAMVHTIAGAANSLGGLITASRGNLPILFTAGRTPINEQGARGTRSGAINWGQESFDQGGMLREWMKWDYELRHGNDVEAIVDRALAISQTEPQGPVYLTLPREVLAEEVESFAYSERPRMRPPLVRPDDDTVEEVANVLAQAKNPVFITRALGRDQSAVPEFVKLAETLQAPVFDLVGFQAYYNFPLTNPLHAGSDAGAFLAEADVVLVAECDVPWVIGSGREPGSEATIISLGHDPLYSRIPVRGFRIDIPVAGQPRLSLKALNEALSTKTVDQSARHQRTQRWAEHQEKLLMTLEERALAGRSSRPLNKAWVSYCMEQLRDESTVMVNELGFDTTYFRYSHPGSTYAFSSAGVLGWGVGAALGIKLAAPEKTVIAGLGDGSYMFGVPEAGHWVGRKMGLPVLYVIWNNAQWGAVANATRQVFPDGWAARNQNFAFTDLSPSIDFEKICEAAGGYGERVEDPEEVIPALKRGLHAVQVEKRTALLNMIGEQR